MKKNASIPACDGVSNVPLIPVGSTSAADLAIILVSDVNNGKPGTFAAGAAAIGWSQVDTVLLDMDGTLLDLHFDDALWHGLLPQRLADREAASVDEIKARLRPDFAALEGQLKWYCLDHWSTTLAISISALELELVHLIRTHPHVEAFLSALARGPFELVLATNAHQRSLALKLEVSGIGHYFDTIVSAHALGSPKEDPQFWQRLQQKTGFTPSRTMLIDDNLAALRAARDFGIPHLFCASRPNSQRPPKDPEEFPEIASFADVMPG